MPDPAPSLLVIGHAASGKSDWAEAQALAMADGGPGRAVYVATAEAWDDEMKARIADHAARRGAAWRLIERPPDLAAACAGLAAADVALVDCATLWLTSLVMRGAQWRDPAEAWIAAMRAGPARFVVVTNDVGGGVVPDNAAARAFQRDQGALNRMLAAALPRVATVTAGLPVWLKR